MLQFLLLKDRTLHFLLLTVLFHLHPGVMFSTLKISTSISENTSPCDSKSYTAWSIRFRIKQSILSKQGIWFHRLVGRSIDAGTCHHSQSRFRNQARPVTILSNDWCVTIDRFWIDDSIYCSIWYSAWQHFTIYGYTHTHRHTHTLCVHSKGFIFGAW
jgi:hypothetical protein